MATAWIGEVDCSQRKGTDTPVELREDKKGTGKTI